ncbi:MAG: protease modulator HflK, partial [Thiomicrorhabdus sp.]|nr:protease modulator HflK [Thiomicrorhabdus sp.]
ARELEEASAYHDRVIAQAVGESSRFVSIVKEYQAAPEVTRNRLYIDAMATVLSNTSKVFVGSDSSNNLLYLPLDKMVSQGQATVPFAPTQQAAPLNSGSVANRQQNSSTGQRTNIRDILKNRELR